MSSFKALLRPALLSLLVATAGCSQAVERPSVSPTTVAGAKAQQLADSTAMLELGVQFAQAGDSVRAEQYLAAAMDAGADPNVALLPLLKLCIKAGRFEAAAQYAEMYQKDVAAGRELDMLLSGLYVTLEQDEKAIAQLKRVTHKYPSYPLAHFLLGRLLKAQQRELELADDNFRAYLKLDPDGNFAGEAQESLLKHLSDAEQLPNLTLAEPSGETP